MALRVRATRRDQHASNTSQQNRGLRDTPRHCKHASNTPYAVKVHVSTCLTNSCSFVWAVRLRSGNKPENHHATQERGHTSGKDLVIIRQSEYVSLLLHDDGSGVTSCSSNSQTQQPSHQSSRISSSKATNHWQSTACHPRQAWQQQSCHHLSGDAGRGPDLESAYQSGGMH